MVNKEKMRLVRRKTRRRLLFTAITLGLYFTYVLSYTKVGAVLGDTLGDSHISGSLALYVGLIVVFIALEIVFLWLSADKRSSTGGEANE